MSVMRFWLEMGVDGPSHWSAVPYIIKRKEPTANRKPSETHAVLKRIRAEVDATFPGRMLFR